MQYWIIFLITYEPQNSSLFCGLPYIGNETPAFIGFIGVDIDRNAIGVINLTGITSAE